MLEKHQCRPDSQVIPAIAVRRNGDNVATGQAKGKNQPYQSA
jgi:hypothetical protein